MNFRDLDYILAVARLRNFSAAAKACHVSQPSLSAQIKKVEEELGAPIFERAARTVHLTAYGQVFIEKAQRILDEAEAMRSLARNANPFEGRLKLGAIATVAPYYFPHILNSLRLSAPRLTLELQEGQTAGLLAQVMAGDLDAAVVSGPVDYQLFDFAPLFTDKFYLAVPEDHRLSMLKTARDKDFFDENLLLLDEGHCLRHQALNLCRHAGLQESKAFRASSLETIRHIIASGGGVTLMPGIARRSHDGIVYIPLEDDGYRRVIGLSWRKSSPQKSFFMSLGEILRPASSEAVETAPASSISEL